MQEMRDKMLGKLKTRYQIAGEPSTIPPSWGYQGFCPGARRNGHLPTDVTNAPASTLQGLPRPPNLGNPPVNPNPVLPAPTNDMSPRALP